MRHFKIRDKRTGLFSRGGTCRKWSPSFDEDGVLWNGTGALRNHVKQWTDHQSRVLTGFNKHEREEIIKKFLQDFEIIEIEFIVLNTVECSDIKNL